MALKSFIVCCVFFLGVATSARPIHHCSPKGAARCPSSQQPTASLQCLDDVKEMMTKTLPPQLMKLDTEIARTKKAEGFTACIALLEKCKVLPPPPLVSSEEHQRKYFSAIDQVRQKLATLKESILRGPVPHAGDALSNIESLAQQLLSGYAPTVYLVPAVAVDPWDFLSSTPSKNWNVHQVMDDMDSVVSAFQAIPEELMKTTTGPRSALSLVDRLALDFEIGSGLGRGTADEIKQWQNFFDQLKRQIDPLRSAVQKKDVKQLDALIERLLSIEDRAHLKFNGDDD